MVVFPVRLQENNGNTFKTKASESGDQTGDLENANFPLVNTEKQIHTFDTDVP